MTSGHDIKPENKAAAERQRLEALGFWARAKSFNTQLAGAGGRELFDLRGWYVGGTEDEYLSIACSREHAMRVALAEGTHQISEASQRLTAFRVDASAVLERAIEDEGHPIEAEFGANGEHHLDRLGDDAIAQLQGLLDAAVSAWVILQDVRAFNLVDFRSEDLSPEGSDG